MIAVSPSNLWKKRLGDWVVNPYVGCEHGCVFCYCPAMPGVKFHNAGHSQAEWGQYVIPKEGIVEALKKQLRRFTPERAVADGQAWGAGYVLLSFLTDCYQPSEAKLKLTRECLKLLLEAGHRVRIQTRSALVERDFDILTAHRGQVLLGTSLPTLDERSTRAIEPRASGITRRIVMLERARAAGLTVYAAIAPVMPWTLVDEMRGVIERIAPFEPLEIFCEVLNPKGTNLGMVARALRETGFLMEEKAVVAYDAATWARRTYDVLRAGSEMHPAFVPWPDTGRAWRRYLSEPEADWLTQFLPNAEVAS